MKTSYRLFRLAQIILISYISILTSHICTAQNVGMNSTGATPNSSAKLDLQTGNNYASPNGKGLLIPTASLTSTGDAVTVNTPATSLLVYNAATAGVSPNNVLPGFYYWNGVKWVAFEGSGSNNWALLGNAGTVATTNFMGSTDANDVVFKANNAEVFRMGNANKNLMVNSTNNTNAFLSSATSTAMHGIYSLVTGASTGNAIFAETQSTTADALVVKVTNASSSSNCITADATGGNGKGNAINASGNGLPNYSTIYGVSTPSVSGTGFDITLSNHTIGSSINLSAANCNYAFAIHGEVQQAQSEPSAGVIGLNSHLGVWGALGYRTIGSVNYGGYFDASQTSGTGRMSSTASQNDLSNIGIGAYGDLFGAVVKGTAYGMTVSGERVSLFVDGKTVVNQPITEVTRTASNQTMVNYTSVSATPVLQLNGTARMVNGVSVITIDRESLSQYANIEDLTIIATPAGQTNGVYAELSGNELTIKENNGGTSNTKVSWIIVGQRNVQNTALPDEVKATDFDANLKGFMHSENDKTTPSTGLYWDGNKLNTGISPTAKGKH